MTTPLFDTLQEYENSNPLRMHMPGHKGKGLFPAVLSPLSPLDVTELTPTGDLFGGEGDLISAQQRWADIFSMAHCLFLTGGSTQGILTALTLSTPPNSEILVDRGSHKSVYHGLALLGLSPHYLERPWLEEGQIGGAVDPDTVANHLENHPNIKTVCITSPTYYGVLSDIPAISAVCQRYGATLMVDGAHGAHLPFLGIDHYSHAHLAVVSAHKTLPAMGQGALLLSSDKFPQSALRKIGSIYGSSSPSYPIMASMDGCRDYLEGEGQLAYEKTAQLVAQLRGQFPSINETVATLDPCRFVLLCDDGKKVAQELESYGIFVEMADSGHVVCILTCADGQEEVTRLAEGLSQMGKTGWGTPAPVGQPPVPTRVMTPREGLFAPQTSRPLCQCEGYISASLVAPYPPGVPILAFGEEITKKSIAYLASIGYNMEETIDVLKKEVPNR